MLLDTHALLWYAQGNAELPPRLVDFISTQSGCCIGRVSLWEVAIKVTTGKMRLGMEYASWLRLVQSQGFRLLDNTDQHLTTLTTLPLHHHDSFDRLLIAQAISENLTLPSRDAHSGEYSVRVRW